MSQASSTKSTVRTRRELWLAAALALLTFLVFWPVKNFEFVNYDDPAYVTEVPQIRDGLSARSLAWAFTDTGPFGGYPVTSLSYLLDSQLFGVKPGGFHFTNLLLHVANTLLVFFLFRRMTGKSWRSAILAGLFALHPLRVEPVAWISSRKDVLSAFFGLLSIFFYVVYVEGRRKKAEAGKNAFAPSPTHSLSHSLPFYSLALFFFVLSLMSKAMFVTLPFALLLLDFWPLNRLKFFPIEIRQWKFVLLEKIPFLVLSVAATLVTFWIQNKAGALASAESLPIGARLGNALVSYLLYLGKMFWPDNLAVIYPYPDPWNFWQIAGAALILCAISFFAFKLAKRHPYFITGWLWFLGTLLPVIGLIQIGSHSMADRYTYLPLLGLFVILIWGIAELAQPRSAANLSVKISAAILLLVCAVLSRAQLQHWQNSESLLSHAVKVTPKNYLAYNNLGAAFEGSGKLDAARNCFAKALEIKPDHVKSHYNLALLWIKQGDPAQAQQLLERVLWYSPNHAGAHYNLANILDDLGHTAEAAAHYSTALQIRPGYAEARNNFAILLSKQGRRDEAILQFRGALQSDPDNLDALCNLGAVLLEQGNIGEALPLLDKAADIASAANDTEKAAQLRARLELYRKGGKPFHQ